MPTQRKSPCFPQWVFVNAWERKIRFLPSQCRHRYLSEIRLILTPYVHIQTHTLLHLKHEYILLTALLPLSIHCNHHVMLPPAFISSLRREILKSSIRIFVFTTIPNILANGFSFYGSRPDVKHQKASHFRVFVIFWKLVRSFKSSFFFPYLWLRKFILILYKTRNEGDGFEKYWTLLAKSKQIAFLSWWCFKIFAIKQKDTLNLLFECLNHFSSLYIFPLFSWIKKMRQDETSVWP